MGHQDIKSHQIKVNHPVIIGGQMGIGHRIGEQDLQVGRRAKIGQKVEIGNR